MLETQTCCEISDFINELCEKIPHKTYSEIENVLLKQNYFQKNKLKLFFYIQIMLIGLKMTIGFTHILIKY